MLAIITIICVAQLVTYLAEPIQDIKLKLNIKKYYVLNCSLCFAFWTALIYFTIMSPILAIPYACITGVGSELLCRLMNRLG